MYCVCGLSEEGEEGGGWVSGFRKCSAGTRSPVAETDARRFTTETGLGTGVIFPPWF